MSLKRKASYSLHKTKGLAYVPIDGQQIYLGEYGSPESFDKYNDLVSEWMTANAKGQERYKMTVDELALLYLKFAEGCYRKNGKQTSALSYRLLNSAYPASPFCLR